MRVSSFVHGVLRLLFIFYCVEAGVLLIVAPWREVWDRLVVQVPYGSLRVLFLHPLFRGAVSGFGFIHLVWGAHDLDDWLARRRSRGDLRAQ
jgi:hypothetical protein